MPEKECEVCGKRFAARMVTQTVCSRECRKKKDRLAAQERMRKLRGEREKEKKACPICGKSFVPKNSLQKYCGELCRAEGEKLRQRKRVRKKATEEKEERVCPVCGKRFIPYSSRQKVCSDYACSTLAGRARRYGRTIEEQAEREKGRAAKQPPKKKEKALSPLAQKVEEARALDMSYGRYIALTEGPMKPYLTAQEQKKRAKEREAQIAELERELGIVRAT